MATRSQKVWDMVMERLEKEPAVDWVELKQDAEKLDQSIAKLTQRQFNARYPLQASRMLKQGGVVREAAEAPAGQEVVATPARTTVRSHRNSRRGRKPKIEERRARAREILLAYAQELVQVESKAEVVEALAKLDDYLDRLETAYRVS